jgi:hypothetical protein
MKIASNLSSKNQGKIGLNGLTSWSVGAVTLPAEFRGSSADGYGYIGVRIRNHRDMLHHLPGKTIPALDRLYQGA